jgi:aspartate carbamoyltransferase regulatory subunit
MKKLKQNMLEVAAIEEGIVLDHLPSDKVLKIVKILALEEEHCITIGLNLTSKKMGKKGIIKINGGNLTEAEMNKIAILAPDVTTNTIKEYAVVKKKKIALRDIEPDTIRCNNPNCITNHEPATTMFHIVEREPLKLRCHFCEMAIEQKEITFL